MMISELHTRVKKMLKEMFPGNKFLYELSYSKILGGQRSELSCNSNKLHADIYDQTLGIVYEIQGEQHYKSVGFFGGAASFDRQQIVDGSKRALINESDFIDLIEIPYDFNLTKKSLLNLIKEVKE